MISLFTWQLLAVLLIAAFLGGVIGSAIMRLWQVQRLKEAYNSQQAAVEELQIHHDNLTIENNRIVQVLESERRLSAVAQNKHSQLTAQAETLQAHTGLQARHLSQLDAKLHAAEEKNIRLERDFASFRFNKQREVSLLKSNPNEWSDNGNRSNINQQISQERAGFERNAEAIDAEAIDPDLTQPIIASELDIPSLAESELPDTVADLEFDLADTIE